MKTKCKNGNIVDNWYDRRYRSSVIAVKDHEGNQIGEAEYVGNRADAKAARERAIEKNGGKATVDYSRPGKWLATCPNCGDEWRVPTYQELCSHCGTQLIKAVREEEQ